MQWAANVQEQEEVQRRRIGSTSSRNALTRPQNPTRLFEMWLLVLLRTFVRIGSELRLLCPATKNISDC